MCFAILNNFALRRAREVRGKGTWGEGRSSDGVREGLSLLLSYGEGGEVYEQVGAGDVYRGGDADSGVAGVRRGRVDAGD